MKETYQELLARQERERTEWEERDRGENKVTVQTSNYGEKGVPYYIEIKFSGGLFSTESNRVCLLLHEKLESWLTLLGYEFSWLPPKSHAERTEEIERLNRLKKDLPQSVMAELAAIMEAVDNVNDMAKWPAAAHRGYEKMSAVVKAARGEL